MKTWQFWVIIALVLLVIVPMIYFAIAANAVAKIPLETLDSTTNTQLKDYNSQRGVVINR